jgi:AcrR family transcriptional regulator
MVRLSDVKEPAYTRLEVDERRAQLIAAGSELFAEHAFEELSMRQIAHAAGVSKALLYHYFPSKADLFNAAVAQQAAELEALIDPTGDGPAIERLSRALDTYLAWIQEHDRAWAKLMQSAATLPEGRDVIELFRSRTLERILRELTGRKRARPALRTALTGWLGYIDAAILDWIDTQDLTREQLRDLLLTSFAASLHAATQIDPQVKLRLDAA